MNNIEKMFDIIGCNYYTLPKRHFGGNFWWSTAKYLKDLPPLILGVNLKYDAENWLLGTRSARAFIHHFDSIHNPEQSYPRALYVFPEDRDCSEREGVCEAQPRDSHQLATCVNLPSVT